MCYRRNRINHGISVLFHELMAIKKGLEMAHELGLQQIIIQSDSRLAVDCITGVKSCPWRSIWFFLDIKALAHRFLNLTFVFVYRQANRVADCLAGMQNCIGEHTDFCHEIPRCLLKIVEEDARF